MERHNRLAVLVPVFNGGDHLLRSIASCSNAALRPDEYEVVVVDNCSDDTAVADLTRLTPDGAPIHIFHNEQNIGRVRNWNRAVSLALELGFRYITFLFAGDCWTAGPALRELLDCVRVSGARAGFAPFIVTDAHGAPKQQSRRFYVSGDQAAVCSAEQFVTRMLESGMFPLGPLQANIYRIDRDNPLSFDPAHPTRTDVQATLDFVRRTNGPIAITSRPFLEWREHGGRFHASMGPARTIEDYMQTFHSACLQTKLPVNYARAKSRVVLNSMRLMFQDAPPVEWPRLLSVIATCSRRTPYRVSALHILETLWSRFALGRRLLQFG